VAALRRIADELDNPWATTAAARIANALRETEWKPLDPAGIQDIIDDSKR
jgi:hypothetical protein